MENSLSYVNFRWFFATTVPQWIIFMFLVKTKLVENSICESFRFSLAVFMEKIKKIRYLNYVRRIIGFVEDYMYIVV